MIKTWHLEHADGSKWTDAELNELTRNYRRWHQCSPLGGRCMNVCVDPQGILYLLDSWGEWNLVDYEDDEKDMVVVYE